jgi:CheY-like chemotaxis protein
MLKILIVDDEDDVLYSLKRGFEIFNDDYKVQTAKDGSECLEALSHETPDLILLDLMMPNMNGWQVLHIIQENIQMRDIPVFIISAVEKQEFKQTAEDLGIPFIEKPFSFTLLKKKIDQFFNIQHAHSRLGM